MAENKRVLYTTAMDAALLDEVALTNPFQDGVTWEDMFTRLQRSPDRSFENVKTSKSLRDRTLLKLSERKRQLTLEERGSGIEVPDLTDEQRVLDEILLLKEEAERCKKVKVEQRKAGVKADSAAQIRDAAMRQSCAVPPAATRPPAATTPPSADETASTSPASSDSTPQQKRRASDVSTLWREREEREERWRKEDAEARQQLQETGLALRTKELEERREERKLNKRRLELEEKRFEEEKNQREDERKLRRLEMDNQTKLMQQMLQALIAVKK